jgi:hypothetical protein
MNYFYCEYSSTLMPNIFFSEEQRFNQLFTWLIIAPVLAITSYQLFEIVADKTRPIPSEELIGLGIAFVVTVGVGLLFYHMKLITQINNAKIHIRFTPFVNKTIHWTEVNRAFITTYKPIMEYGGWGIRRRTGKTAYSVSGKQGLQLVLKNGKMILIGTQKSDEIAYLLKRRAQED